MTLVIALTADRFAELEASLQFTQEQLNQSNPNPSPIPSSLATGGHILEGGTANVVASGWLRVLEGLVL